MTLHIHRRNSIVLAMFQIETLVTDSNGVLTSLRTSSLDTIYTTGAFPGPHTVVVTMAVDGASHRSVMSESASFQPLDADNVDVGVELIKQKSRTTILPARSIRQSSQHFCRSLPRSKSIRDKILRESFWVSYGRQAERETQQLESTQVVCY